MESKPSGHRQDENTPTYFCYCFAISRDNRAAIVLQSRQLPLPCEDVATDVLLLTSFLAK